VFRAAAPVADDANVGVDTGRQNRNVMLLWRNRKCY